MSSHEAATRTVTVDLEVEAALDLLEQAAESWGGEWRHEGRDHLLFLPVTAGIRKGFVAARIDVVGDGSGSRIEVVSADRHLRTNVAATGILAFGALGGLVAVLWPFFPRLLQLAPIAAVLAVVAWLLVAGRLRTHGLDEFLSMVEASADGGDDDPSGEPA